MSPHHHEHSSEKRVDPLNFDEIETLNDLALQWSASAVFAGGHLGKAIDILTDTLKNDGSIMVGLAGAMVPAGMRKVISMAMKKGFITALTTTGANITHDLIEAIGGSHIHSLTYEDDNELYQKGIDRVYDAFVSSGSFGKFEEFITSSLKKLMENHEESTPLILSQSEMIDYLGSQVEDEDSIVRTAHQLGIPIFVPAISDSVLGLQIWLFSQFNKLVIDSTLDLGKIQDVYHENSRNCALLLGGGVPKNYTLQAALMTGKHYDAAVQVTLDRVETGGLSGADLEEAKSWGKLEPNAETVTVICDLTIALPIIFGTLNQRFPES